MKKQFDKQYVIDNKGCYSYEDVEKLSFINKKEITINDILRSEIKLKDKGWWLANKTDLTRDQKVQLAYELAYVVLPIFEEKYPNDKRVRECLDAVQLYKEGKITVEDLHVKRSACWSARADAAYADAAYADAAYADAAYADAAYAADAAAYAADAAYTAAYAADAAYTATAYADAAYAAAYATAYAAAYAADESIVKKIVNKIKGKKKEKSYLEKVLDVMIKFAKTTE